MLQKRDELGPWSFAEVSVLVIFLSLILIWFFRSPGFMTGWGDLLSENYNGEVRRVY
jgi:sodium-dependent dicarboxylate transporter 2/3/5